MAKGKKNADHRPNATNVPERRSTKKKHKNVADKDNDVENEELRK